MWKSKKEDRTMKVNHNNLMSLVGLLIMAGILTGSPAMAGAAQGQDVPPAEDVTQDDLKTFAEAYTQVTQIYNQYEQRIINSSEPTEANALQQEANQKMNQAVMDTGLSIEDYNSMYRAIENDQGLQNELTQVLSQVE
jgi:hypothetical protein